MAFGHALTLAVKLPDSCYQEDNPMDPVKQSAAHDARKKMFSLFEEFKNFAFATREHFYCMTLGKSKGLVARPCSG